jgi:curved DNA-binding protein CbpA
MGTLYELLGALSHDSAEELRTAFRQAVKGAHPDLRPDDPDAALKFREIVRAKEILRDPEQREVYDHLLDLARIEEESASSTLAIADKIHSLTSAVIAVISASVVIIGGYLLYASVSSSGSFASANSADTTVSASQIAAAYRPLETTEKPDVSAELDRKSTSGEPIAFRTIKTTQRSPNLGLIANVEVESMQAPQFNRDRDFVIAGIGPALQPAVVFYRKQQFDGAFPIFLAKSTQTSKSFRSVPKITRRPRLDQVSRMPLTLSIFQTRQAGMDGSRKKRIAQIH